MLLPPCFDGAVQPHPYMRCSAGVHQFWFCLPSAIATLKTYSLPMNFCRRRSSTGLWIFLHILCRSVVWGASKPCVRIRFPLCSLYTSSTPGPLAAQMTHTICTLAFSDFSEQSLKIHPWVSFYGTSDTLVLRDSCAYIPCTCPVLKSASCPVCLPSSTLSL